MIKMQKGLLRIMEPQFHPEAEKKYTFPSLDEQKL
jgi:hypothetical protein